MASEKILVVEDDIEISNLIQLYLQKEDFEIVATHNGKNVVDLIQTEKPDFIILDILLPGMDGYEICSRIRHLTTSPILFLSCKNEDMDKVLGLGLGADDYMTKPFSPFELVARVKAHLRRMNRNEETAREVNMLKHGDIELHLLNHTVLVNGHTVNLSKKEFELLAYFIQNPEQPFTLEDLYEGVWGSRSFSDIRTVMVHIHNLRKKIELDPSNSKYIQTVRGVGYRFSSIS